MLHRTLFTLALLLGLLLPAAAAAVPARDTNFAEQLASPASISSGPCAPGAAYDPACDVDHDGDVDVLDVQLAAGHWNQTGAWVSDNGHDHLGQTWTGSNNPLKITGSYGDPDAPLVLSNTASSGGSSGLRITSAGVYGVRVDSTGSAGVVVVSAGGYGVEVFSAGDTGVFVGSAANDGMHVNSAGSPSSYVTSPLKNGFEVFGAQGHGFYVGRADANGVDVFSAGGNGMRVGSADGDGLVVASAGDDGVQATGDDFAGNFIGNIYVSGNCTGCLQANFAVNVGNQALEPGDVVSIQAITSSDFDTGTALWQVMQAQPGMTVVGVVAGRAEVDIQEEHRPGETGQRLVPRAGAAQPGAYVTIVYSGPMQVKAAPGEAPIVAGTRLTAAADGTVRPLQTRTVDGMVVAEGAPVLGVVLAEAVDGLVWVLVNPQ